MSEAYEEIYTTFVEAEEGTDNHFSTWEDVRAFRYRFRLDVTTAHADYNSVHWFHSENKVDAALFEIPPPLVVYNTKITNGALNISFAVRRDTDLIKGEQYGSVYRAVLVRLAKADDFYNQLPLIQSLKVSTIEEKRRYQETLDRLYGESWPILNALCILILSILEEAGAVFPEENHWRKLYDEFDFERITFDGKWKTNSPINAELDVFKRRLTFFESLTVDYRWFWPNRPDILLFLATEYIWECMIRAADEATLRGELFALCAFFRLKASLAMFIWHGLRYSRQEIEPIVTILIELDAQRAACEKLQNAIVRNQPIPSLEEMLAELTKGANGTLFDGRTMHSENKDWVIEKYNELRKNDPTASKSHIYEKIIDAYEAEFGDELRRKHGSETDVEISSSTIRRYLGVK